jgi:hypothetical protein
MRGCRPRYEIATFVRVDGERSRNISIMNNDLRKAANMVEKGKDVTQDTVYLEGQDPT